MELARHLRVIYRRPRSTPQGTKEAARPRRQPPRGLRSSSPIAPSPLLAESHLFGQARTSGGIIRRHHRIIRRQSPFLAILLRSHVVLRAQVTLESLSENIRRDYKVFG